MAHLQKKAGWVCLGVGLLALAIRLALLPVRPIPEPTVQDEFAYLLGAETFYLERFTNPPHPMWVHFETFHENFLPTYASKYPPAQSLFLALGWRLFGHPWYGVWLSCGLMCAALCWMLQAWLPPRYALMGGLTAVTQWGVAGYWIDSYWGGAVAAAAGALVVGAVPRLARRPSAGSAAMAALGVLALGNSRPYEGTVVAVAAAGALLLWRRRTRRPFKELLAWHVGAPVAVILGCGLAGMLYYNYRVTGNVLRMPYQVNHDQYGIAPIFWMMAPKTPPVYRHEAIRKLWMDLDVAVYHRARASPGRVVMAFCRMLPVFITPVALAGAAIAAIFRRSRKVCYALAMLAFCTSGLLLERTSLPHYFAPAAGLMLALAAMGAQYMHVRWGRSALVIFAALFCINAGFNVVLDPDPCANRQFAARRTRVMQRLERAGGQHLVIVRYAPDHNVLEEWVYNHADIDGSAIVWARDMGDAGNRELVNYYRNRSDGRPVWLLEADAPDPKPMPYEPR
jgi:hypothetical protein